MMRLLEKAEDQFLKLAPFFCWQEGKKVSGRFADRPS
jgi:hypothetical protein